MNMALGSPVQGDDDDDDDDCYDEDGEVADDVDEYDNDDDG